MATKYTITDSSEEALRWWWQAGDLTGLVTRDGVRLQVVYRGRGNRGAGPDFRDVVLATAAAELWQGDLEVDRLSSLWWAHGHHQDPAYNGVVLHLVGRADTPRVSRRQDGVAVAVACLGEVPWGGASATNAYLCQRPEREEVGRVLDRLGEERFRDKVARFAGALSQEPPGEVLYQGLMESLGYPQNREAFLRLAQALPLATVEGFLWGKSSERAVSWAEALLLGAGGLLAHSSALGRLWAAAALSQDGVVGWRWAGGRPFNHPERRLRGLARLLVRHQRPGMVAALAGALESGHPRALETVLTVAGDGEPAFIGGERAREMAINVVLPFFAAGGESATGSGKAQAVRLSAQAEALFAAYPPGADNALLRQMVDQLGPELKSELRSARRQQGLLHLYRRFCTQGRCHQCPWTKSGLNAIIICGKE